MVYDRYKIYGPYMVKKLQRLIILAKDESGKIRTVSYPKYLMECSLNRYLDPNETIDHIDGNPLNNDLSNLRILPRKLHCSRDSLRNENVCVRCEYCGKLFTIQGNHILNHNKHKSGYFCSRSCSGHYGAEIQRGMRDKNIVDSIEYSQYKLRDLDDI